MKNNLLIVALITSCLLGGCAGMDGFWCDLRGTPQYYVSQRTVPLQEVQAFPRQCLAGDSEILDLAQCSTMSAACYQLDTGSWCTAARPGICPSDTVPEYQEADCPAGADCWMYSPNLRCRSV
ncbi:hypothetical protein [Microbulbifer hainanensis]|uniref:hypothetical protein n=1 Tax=Microbulbifer hainanensis TaxID=2735675 RepID=UPI001868EAF1|nr:hypothetical protein [Microbulbifer hainanensis]